MSAVATMPQHHPGPHMNIDCTSTADPSPQNKADAALHAMTDLAKAANLASIAELSEDVHECHVAAHIRGMVAATMGSLSSNGTDITRNNAEHWQDWGLAVADGWDVATAPTAV